MIIASHTDFSVFLVVSAIVYSFMYVLWKKDTPLNFYIKVILFVMSFLSFGFFFLSLIH